MFVFGEDSSNSKWSIEGLYLFVSAKDLHTRKGSAAMLALAHLRRAARAHPWVPATWNFQVCWSIAPMPKTTLVYFLEDQSPHLPQQIAKQAQDGLAHVKRSDDFPNHQTSLNQGPKGTCSVKNCCGVSEELARGIGFSAAAAQPGRIPCSIGGKPRFFGSVDEAARAQSQHSDMQRRPTTSRNEKTASGSSRLANRWARRINNLSHWFYKQKGQQLISASQTSPHLDLQLIDLKGLYWILLRV